MNLLPKEKIKRKNDSNKVENFAIKQHSFFSWRKEVEINGRLKNILSLKLSAIRKAYVLIALPDVIRWISSKTFWHLEEVF
jgi:hypothetical protein